MIYQLTYTVAGNPFVTTYAKASSRSAAIDLFVANPKLKPCPITDIREVALIPDTYNGELLGGDLAAYRAEIEAVGQGSLF